MRIVGYVYDADIHCEHCTEASGLFERNEHGFLVGIDHELNELHPIFDFDEIHIDHPYCGNCLGELDF